MATTQITAEPGVPQLIVTSEFAAPRDLLFRAYTDPGLLAQWAGPRELTFTIDDFDPRHGGTWHYTSGDADGNEYSCRGVFHGTPSPDGIARTFEFEGRPGQVCLETIFFSERGDTTIVTQSSVYQSIQDRDWALRYDNAEDIYESIERLDDLIPRLVLLSRCRPARGPVMAAR